MAVRERRWIAAGLVGARRPRRPAAAAATSTTTADHGETAREHRRRAAAPATADAGDRPPVGDGDGGVRLEQVGEFDQPVYVTQPPGDDDTSTWSSSAGRIQRIAARRRRAERLPRPRRPGHLRRRAGPALGRLRPRLRGVRPALRQLHRHRGRLAHGRVPALGRRPGGRRPGPAPASCCGSTTSPRTTTAACCCSGPTASSTPGWATAAAPAIPSAPPRTPSSPLGKLLRIDPAEAGGYEVAALGLRNPWRYSFDRENGRPLDRRRRPERARGDRRGRPRSEFDAPDRRSTSAGRRSRAPSASTPTRRRPARSPPVYEYGRDGGCSVTGGYVVRDPRLDLALRPLPLRRLLRGRAAQLHRGPGAAGARRPRARAAGRAAELVRRGRRRAASTRSRSPGPSTGCARPIERARLRSPMAGGSGRGLWQRSRASPRSLVGDRRSAAAGAAGRPRRRCAEARAGSAASTPRSTSTTRPARRSCCSSSSSRARSGSCATARRSNRDFLDIRDRVQYGGEEGLLSVAFDPGYARNRRFYVYYVNQRRQHRGRRLPAQARAPPGADARSRRQGDRGRATRRLEPQRRPAPVRPRRLLYLGTGDGGSGRRPGRQRPEPERACSASCCGSTRARAAATRPRARTRSSAATARTRSTRSACATPTASRSTARPATSAIGDVGQDAWEEIDRAGPARARGANFGWDIFEGDHDFEGGGAPGELPPAGVRVLVAAAATARSPAATSSATRRCRRSPAATSTPTSAAASCAPSTPRTPARATPPPGSTLDAAELVRRGRPAAGSTSPRSTGGVFRIVQR